MTTPNQPPPRKTPCEMGVHQADFLVNADGTTSATCRECGESLVRQGTTWRPKKERWETLPRDPNTQSKVVGRR